MADADADLTQLDLQNLSPEEAAKLARAQQAALAKQQSHALLGLLGAAPELQKAGALEYGQAGKEREGGQQTAANVLKQALGEKEAAARLEELRNQNVYQRGMLAIALGREQRESKHEDFQQMLERFKAEIAAQRPPTGEVEADLIKSASRLSWLKSVHAPRAVVDFLEKEHKAKQKAVEELGYRTGGTPQWPAGANVSPAVPRAPEAGGNVSVTGAPPASDMVRVQIPGHPPGSIHRSQLPAFKAKHPDASVGP